MLYDDIAFGLALSLHLATTNQEGLKSWSVHCQRKRSVRGQAKVAESPEFRLKQVSPPLADCPKGQAAVAVLSSAKFSLAFHPLGSKDPVRARASPHRSSFPVMTVIKRFFVRGKLPTAPWGQLQCTAYCDCRAFNPPPSFLYLNHLSHSLYQYRLSCP